MQINFDINFFQFNRNQLLLNDIYLVKGYLCPLHFFRL